MFVKIIKWKYSKRQHLKGEALPVLMNAFGCKAIRVSFVSQRANSWQKCLSEIKRLASLCPIKKTEANMGYQKTREWEGGVSKHCSQASCEQNVWVHLGVFVFINVCILQSVPLKANSEKKKKNNALRGPGRGIILGPHDPSCGWLGPSCAKLGICQLEDRSVPSHTNTHTHQRGWNNATKRRSHSK